jgi:hypothetical protein
MKRSLAAGLLALIVLVPAPPVAADEPENHDFDVICEQAKVLPYQLPPLLVSSEGKPITTADEWFNLKDA